MKLMKNKIKYIVIILISFILLSLLSCGGDGIRRNDFYTPNGNYDGYSICDTYGCAFYNRYGIYEGHESF